MALFLNFEYEKKSFVLKKRGIIQELHKKGEYNTSILQDRKQEKVEG